MVLLTPDTTTNESWKETAEGVARSSGRFCSREAHLCCYRRIEYDLTPLSTLFSFLSIRLTYFFVAPPTAVLWACRPLRSLTLSVQLPAHLWAFML